ncbi:MAG: argininosuccinate lyase [Candidatus Melainabacteria bacterium GWF2_37_15]|nr:MAG: argininosuccinate lyase [Candidatus Melainabacteria bacterium GWF2_37_15]
MSKLWSGRFQKSTHKLTDDFNSSIHFDQRLYKQDITGSIAHAKMLGKQGIIPQQDAELIQKTLKEILSDIEEGKVEFDVAAEDIHMNVESILIERIGDFGKKLHTGRSRNDQVALDMRMYLKDEIQTLTEMLVALQRILLNLAKENSMTIMPGYTHLQKAQPITLAHHLLAYVEMFKRDKQRLQDTYKRTNVLPLGSGALAGTTYPLDRDFVAQELGFDAVSLNSLDAVSDRDFCIELLSNLSIIMMHLSRFSEEIILWCSHEFQFIELDDAFSTGSSIMPQKKNPDIAELVRGKTGRIYGSLMALLTTMKSLPLAYNKDMQEDKEPVFDAIDNVKMCIPVFTDMVRTMKVNKNKMYEGAKGGFTNATDLADYLVKKGVAFRDAHSIVGKIVFSCIERGIGLEDMTLDEYKAVSSAIENDVFKAISLEECVNKRNIIGGPAEEMVKKAIEVNEALI